MNKFDGATKTKSGTQVKDVKFNNIPSKYLGKIFTDKWLPFMWHKTGKAANGNSNYDLILPEQK